MDAASMSSRFLNLVTLEPPRRVRTPSSGSYRKYCVEHGAEGCQTSLHRTLELNKGDEPQKANAFNLRKWFK